MVRVLPFLLLLSAQLFAQDQDYLWPTNASTYLSGTFGETRSAHFHSGLDIKTWGQEGYKVYASKDGIIYRLAITAQGYGRVIYLKHNDGSFTVYAHLQRFNDHLQELIDSVRLEQHQFEIDLPLESLNIRVNQGDVIGYSGSTGIGPPHLHFEIRDSLERPINPLLTNLHILDEIAPTISSMLIFPLSDSSTVDGSKFPRLFYPSRSLEGSLSFGTIHTQGPVGIAISNFDEADNVSNKYAVFEATLIKNLSDTLFYSKIDSLNFNSTETMFLDRIPALGAYRRSYQTLFSLDGPPISFQKKALTYLLPGDSSSHYQIRLSDINGNQNFADFTLATNQWMPSVMPSQSPIYSWFWNNDWVTSSSNSTYSLKHPDAPFWGNSDDQVLKNMEGTTGILSRIRPDSAYTFWSHDMNLQIIFRPDTFFDTLSVFTYTSELDSSSYFAIYPASAPVRKDYSVRFAITHGFRNGNNYQLFRIDRTRNRLTHVPSKLVGRTLHAQPDMLGEFVALADNAPPTLETPQLIKTSYGKWLITVTATDELSGIDYKNTEIKVNGVRAITEYDFEEDKLIYYHPDFNPKKVNRVEIIVKDNAGNSRFESYQI